MTKFQFLAQFPVDHLSIQFDLPFCLFALVFYIIIIVVVVIIIILLIWEFFRVMLVDGFPLESE